SKKRKRLSDSSQELLKHTQSLASEQVSSDSILTRGDMLHLSKSIKDRSKAEIRSSRIAEKEKERDNIAKSLKEQAANQESNNETNKTMQMVALKLLSQEQGDSKKLSR